MLALYLCAEHRSSLDIAQLSAITPHPAATSKVPRYVEVTMTVQVSCQVKVAMENTRSDFSASTVCGELCGETLTIQAFPTVRDRQTIFRVEE